MYTSNHHQVGQNVPINAGDEVWMEVDLRSGEREGEKRTLHWAVNGVTQKVFFSHMPSSVLFGVCIPSFSCVLLFFYY